MRATFEPKSRSVKESNSSRLLFSHLKDRIGCQSSLMIMVHHEVWTKGHRQIAHEKLSILGNVDTICKLMLALRRCDSPWKLTGRKKPFTSSVITTHQPSLFSPPTLTHSNSLSTFFPYSCNQNLYSPIHYITPSCNLRTQYDHNL